MNRVFWGLVAAVVLVSLAAGTASLLGRASLEATRTEAEGLRDDVRQARSELETCLEERERLEGEFRRLEERTGALRDRIDRMEAMDPRGVPGEVYDEYLSAVDEFNEAVPAWEGRADELERLSSRCQELAEEHNARADSLRGFLVEEGLWDEDWEPALSEPGAEGARSESIQPEEVPDDPLPEP